MHNLSRSLSLSLSPFVSNLPIFTITEIPLLEKLHYRATYDSRRPILHLLIGKIIEGVKQRAGSWLMSPGFEFSVARLIIKARALGARSARVIGFVRAESR